LSFAIELSFLQISSLLFIIKLKRHFLIEIIFNSCSKYTLLSISHWEFCQSFSLWYITWSFVFSLEIDESICKSWFTTKSTWWIQNWINIWFQLVSKSINRFTHLFLFFSVIHCYQFWRLQIVQVNIILRNRSKSCTHVRSKN